jgi:hypothetical protein
MNSVVLSTWTNIEDIRNLVTPLIGIGLYLLSAFFMVRTLVLIFVGQIDIATSRINAISDIIVQGLYMLLTLLLAVNARTISLTITNTISEHSEILTSSSIGNLKYLIEPLGGLLIKLIGTLAVSFTLVAVVFSVFRGQLSAMSGSIMGLSESVFQGIGVILIFAIGIVVIVLGSSLI